MAWRCRSAEQGNKNKRSLQNRENTERTGNHKNQLESTRLKWNLWGRTGLHFCLSPHLTLVTRSGVKKKVPFHKPAHMGRLGSKLKEVVLHRRRTRNRGVCTVREENSSKMLSSVLITRGTASSFTSPFPIPHRFMAKTNPETFKEWKTRQYIANLASAYHKTIYSSLKKPTALYNYIILIVDLQNHMDKKKRNIPWSSAYEGTLILWTE